MTGLTLEAASELARSVLERVEDCHIRVADMSISSGPYQGNRNLTTDSTLNLTAGFSDAHFVCASRYEIEARADEEQPPEHDNHWNVAVNIHGMWVLSSVEGLTDSHAQAFALAVGALALHPYARSHVQTLVTSTGYPPYSLDILQSLLEPDDESGLVELDVVDVFSANSADAVEG